jgi:hypothetical protein
MSTYKRINGDYTIQSIGPNDRINITSNMVTINGNLQVTGNSQTIVSTNSAITDNKITLNHGLSTSSPPNADGAAIEVDRGTAANVQLIWNETVDNWQVTTDGTTYANIATSATAGLANVYADSSPRLSANLIITGQKLSDLGNSVAIYTNTVGGAGSGVYVDNTSSTGAELVTQSKALAYAIIFG